MKLTPMEINNKEFKKVLRGYSIEEVDGFLDKVVEDYEEIFRENALIKEKLASMTEKVDHYVKIENTIQNTLLLAQNTAEQAKANAQKEADITIRSANDTAQKILDKAHHDVIQVNDEYDRVRHEFVKFKSKFRNFMNTQLETFDDLEKEFIKNFNISRPVEEISEKDIQNEEEECKTKNFSEEEIISEEIDEIKSFFANK
ncbi:cell division protein DivIVA [Clostridium polyendosporum]|uniref:Cell division protein DivIVA n=1 Tax=Clostridium polyendosporum TaxID=69208 RepID=A0A919RYM7_9CLOT|nr:DivIVA domain-containing protein [Clostridium polyendosporum]GIM27973.1 cell division protein DivIVA [Clostridium polyendosporum]